MNPVPSECPDRIRTADPRAGFAAIRGEILAAMERVLDAGNYILGPEVAAFESEFAGYLGALHCVGVASGTGALELALRALDIGPGDAVFTVSHTSVATVAAIELVGATPVLVDVDPTTFTMDVAGLEAAVKPRAGDDPKQLPRARAVLPVHLYGHPADMIAIGRIARKYGLRVIEDCSQAHGARIGGQTVGAFGDVAAFSLYPTKNLGALGDAGALVTSDERIAERVRRLRQYGWDRPQHSVKPGTNSRLDELQAAVLRVKLARLDLENSRRRELAGIYDAGLVQSSVIPPATLPGIRHVFHQYVVRSSDRDALHRHLAAAGVDAGIHYPLPVHRQPAYAGRLPCSPQGLRVTDTLCREILSLPVHPHLADTQARHVVDAVLAFAPSNRPG